MATQATRGPSAFGATSAHPRMEVNRKDPAIAAVLAKLVSPQNENRGGYSSRNRALRAPDQALLQRISDMTSTNVTDAASIVQLLPDLELAMQILVSSILSPKDMVTTELNFSVESGQFNSELSGALLDCVRDYFENTYKISEILPTILQDVLFYKGAYPMLILPESSIDDAINSPSRVSMESIADEIDPATKRPHHLGILGNSTKSTAATKDELGLESLSMSFEDFRAANVAAYNPQVGRLKGSFDPMLSVTDNVNLLKVPLLVNKMQQDRVQDALASRKLRTISSEAFGADGPNKDATMYRRRRYKAQPVTALVPGSQLKRGSVGHPLVMTLPAECVIPVHIPSNPEEHLGYFILVDQQGNPLVKATEADYYHDLATNIQGNKEMTSQLIAQTKRNEQGLEYGSQGFRSAEAEEMERIYGDLVEEELRQRLKNGVYGDSAQVSKPQEVYRIMFARALARQATQLVYVPAEMMTYIAFDYNKYGVGISLLQGSKILGGIRAMLLFANTMAAIKNSVGRTELNIQLDPADPDPSTTVEFLITEHARATQNNYPLGASSPREIISFLQNAGVEVAVSGNTAYPETKLSVEDKQSNRAKPDPELEKSLKDRHIMSLGLSPEVVDNSNNAEFATTIVQNNLLMAKRVMTLQNKFVPFLVEFVQKYTLSSGALMHDLRTILEENQDKLTKEQERDKEKAARKVDEAKPRRAADDVRAMTDDSSPYRAVSGERGHDRPDEAETMGLDALVIDFVNAIRVSLPAPDTSSLEKQMEAYDKYAEGLTKALEAYLHPDFLDAAGLGELAEVMPATIAAVKAHYLRQWLRNNNVMTELDELTTFTDEDGPAMDLLKTQQSHMEGLGKSLLTYMQGVLAARKKTDDAYDKTKTELGITDVGAGGGGDTFGADATGGTDDGMGGGAGDDFGDLPGGDDLSGDLGGDTTDADAAASEETDDLADVPAHPDANPADTADKGDEDLPNAPAHPDAAAKTDDTSADEELPRLPPHPDLK